MKNLLLLALTVIFIIPLISAEALASGDGDLTYGSDVSASLSGGASRQPNTVYPTEVDITTTVSVSSLVTASTSTANIQTSPNNSTWTTICTNSITLTSVVTSSEDQTETCRITVSVGDYYRVTTTGTATIDSAYEIEMDVFDTDPLELECPYNAHTSETIYCNFNSQKLSGVWNNDLTFNYDVRGSSWVSLASGTTTNRGRGIYTLSFTAPSTEQLAHVYVYNDTFNYSDSASIRVEETIADQVWDENAGGHSIPASFGKRVRDLTNLIIWSGDVISSTNNTITLDVDASSINGTYDPNMIFITGGAGVGESRLILEYDGSTRTAVVNRDWRVNPDGTSSAMIVADWGNIGVNEGVAQGGTSNTITLNTVSSSFDSIYNGQTIHISAGTGQDEARIILDYNGTTHVATIDGNWDVVPDNTSSYTIYPLGQVDVHTFSSSALQNITYITTNTTQEFDIQTAEILSNTTQEFDSQTAFILTNTTTEINQNEAKIDVIDSIVDSILSFLQNVWNGWTAQTLYGNLTENTSAEARLTRENVTGEHTITRDYIISVNNTPEFNYTPIFEQLNLTNQTIHDKLDNQTAFILTNTTTEIANTNNNIISAIDGSVNPIDDLECSYRSQSNETVLCSFVYEYTHGTFNNTAEFSWNLYDENLTLYDNGAVTNNAVRGLYSMYLNISQDGSYMLNVYNDTNSISSSHIVQVEQTDINIANVNFTVDADPINNHTTMEVASLKQKEVSSSMEVTGWIIFFMALGMVYIGYNRGHKIIWITLGFVLFLGNTIYSVSIPFVVNSVGEVVPNSANVFLAIINLLATSITTYYIVYVLKDVMGLGKSKKYTPM